MHFNINTIKKLLYIAVPALALTSCITEDFDLNENDEAYEVKEELYVAIDVRMPNDLSTRAFMEKTRTDYENGSEAEHMVVTGAHAIFFNKSGTFKELTALSFAEPHEDNVEHNDPGASGEVEARFLAMLNASNSPENQPAAILVVLNSEPIYDQLEAAAKPNATVADFAKIIWTDTYDKSGRVSQSYAGVGSYDGTQFFTLSNATYVDYTGDVHYAYDIPTGVFKKTRKEAEASRGVLVHVERMVAKFTPILYGYTEDKMTYRPYDGNQLTIAMFDDEGEPTYVPQNWSATFIGWGMNGVETKANLFKKIKKSGAYYGWSGWNDMSNYRSYWAEDPHYAKNEGYYPFQYRRAVEKGSVTDGSFKYYSDGRYGSYTGGDEDSYEWALKYYSFNDLAGNAAPDLYAPENTYNEDIAAKNFIDDRSNKVAGTHMLFCAQLKVTDDGLSNFLPVEHLYRDRIGICYYSAADLFWGFVRAVNRKLESQGYMQYMRYYWNQDLTKKPESRYFKGTGKLKLFYNGRELTYEYVKQMAQNTELVEIANILNGDGKVLPWPKDGKLEIRDEEGNPVTKTYYRGEYNEATKDYDYEEVPETFGDEDLRSLFFEWCGAVDHYNGGRMYYAAPILHSKKDENGANDIYGVVRNHWYQLKINSVLNLGTPIDNPDDPIIPDLVRTKDNLKIDVDIIPWHLIDVFVDLPGYSSHL